MNNDQGPLANAANLPQHLVADEKHTWLKGEKIYAPTTVAEGCILGVAATTGAGNVDYENAYGEFAAEARELNPDYSPETVGTDGWNATDNAWRKHSPKITVIICFLHAVLKLKGRCPAYKEWSISSRTKLGRTIQQQREQSFSNDFAAFELGLKGKSQSK